MIDLKLKPKSDGILSLRLPKPIKEKLETEAKRLGASRSQLIVAILEAYIIRRGIK
jgi:predicted DNA-binding protein